MISRFADTAPGVAVLPPSRDPAKESSDADQRLITGDRRLVGLESLLSSDALSELLASTYSLRDVGASAARTTYLRYKPGVSCLAAFEAWSDGRAVRGYVIAYPPDSLKIGKLLRAGNAAVHQRLGIVACLFPQDLVLHSIRKWIEAPREAANSWSTSQNLCGDLRVEVLRYKPERRFVAQLSRDGAPWAALRLYAPGDYLRARQNAKVLGGLAAINTPKRTGHSHRDRGLLQEWLPGRRLSDAIESHAATDDDLRCTGIALARLHQQKCVKLRQSGHDDDAAQASFAAQAIAGVVPEFALRATQLAGRIAEALTELPATIAVRHGDFYGDQVLLDREASLLDLDQAGRGDPAQDIGNFIAHLIRSSVEGAFRQEEIESTTDALLEGYGAIHSVPRGAAISVYAAASLLRLAVEPFRRRDPNWFETTDAMLGRVELLTGALAPPTMHCLAAVAPPSVDDGIALGTQVVATSATLDDPALPQLRLALDEIEANRRIAELLKTSNVDAASLRIASINVVRHKSGRRCLVEYRFARTARIDLEPMELSVIGKTMRRPNAARDFELHRAVFNSPFGQCTRDGIGVPEPLGVLPDWNMWFQHKVDGVPAMQLLSTEDGPRISECIARAIHKLHACGPTPQRVHTIHDEMTTLESRLSEASQRRSELSTRIGNVTEKCRGLVATLAANPARSCHRDFYPEQVLLGGQTLWMCDFDLYALADPALDVGNFAAHLIEYGLRRPSAASALQASRDAFVNRYCQLAPEVQLASIVVYETLSLARHIGLSITLAGRSSATEKLILTCEKRLR